MRDREAQFNDGRLHLCEKLYVPKHLVTQAHLDEFTYIFKEDMELLDGSTERIDVPYYLWQEHYSYYSFHRGDIEKLINLFPQMLDPEMFVDHRSRKPLGFDLQLIPEFQYRTYKTGNQYDALMDLLNPNLGGILKAFPSFGKTVMMTLLALSQRMTVLVLAHKSDLLDQLETTIRNITNIDDFRDSDGHCYNMYRLNKGWDVPPIGTSTFQYLLQNPDFLMEISDQYAIVMVDECHHIGSDGFTTVMLSINSYFRYGFTATDYRKDNLDALFPDLIGPVRHTVERPPLDIDAEVVDTGIKVPAKYQYSQNRAVMLAHNYVAKSEERATLIARRAIQDALDGYIVLILTYRVIAIDLIYEALARELESYIKLNREFPLHIDQVEWITADFKAADIDGVKARLEEGANPATEGGSKIVITTEHKFGEGSDIPPLSALHYAYFTSHRKNIEQTLGRIMREHKWKRFPQKITYYRDGGLAQLIGINRSWVKKMREFGVRVNDPKEADEGKIGNKLKLFTK